MDLRELEGGVAACPGVLLTSVPLCVKSPSSLFDETPRKGLCDGWSSFCKAVFRQIREVQRKPPVHLLLFKCLQLEIVSIPQQHDCRCRVQELLESYF